MKKIFLGPLGLRAGWRVLLFVCLIAAFGYAIGWLVVFLHLPKMVGGNTIRPMAAFIMEVEQLAIAVLATFAMARMVDKQHWAVYGLPIQQAFRRVFWLGTTTGIVALVLQLGVMRLLRVFFFGNVGLNPSEAVRYSAVWALVFVLVAISEESLLRGFLLRALTDGIGFWPAAVLTSALFAWAHRGNPGETKIGLLAVFAVGVFLCFTLRRTGNLWWAVGFHTGWDWAQSYLFGVADSGTVAEGHLLNPTISGNPILSGGSVGPEGSVLIFVTIGVMTYFFHRAYPYALYTRREAPPPAPMTELQPEASA